MTTFVTLWCATAALVSAALAVTRPNVVHGLIWLVATLLSLAAAFFALGAAFAGAVQILVYAGAILAVFVFVVMTYDSAPEALARERARLAAAWRLPAAVVAAVALPLALGLWGAPDAPAAALAEVPARRVGALLFGPWALAVEIASCLLLAALLGARHLGRKGDGR
jgi:NADH-quinone oxidoreductase subunit J